jgi:hypothetical protein
MGGKKGGLIEDRKIRQPMDQMRRKLKFRDKEKRKEVRQVAREIRQEREEKLDSKGNQFTLSTEIMGDKQTSD